MPGKTYGERWTTEAALTEGGQAHTFIVTDKKGENQRYVLKRLKNLKRLDRFKAELDALRGLDSPGIVRVIDFDLEASKPYIVTEYCSKGSLSNAPSLITSKVTEKIDAFSEVCFAIQEAHHKGIIHRDIKPDNIFVRENGTIALGDFGLCYNKVCDR